MKQSKKSKITVEEWLGKENKIGIDIWKNKYCNANETFEQWLDRVSDGDKDLRRLIMEKKFLFGGRILANRGLEKRGKKITMSNCYVIEPPKDNIESIFEAAKKLARTYSYGGGCGIDIGKLAPAGAKINNAAKETSGAVSFMELYDTATGLIGQNGRRGALMVSIPCDHPDIESFIGIKQNTDKITKANISIRVTDEFMQAVVDDKPFELKFVREETGETVSRTVQARELFMRIAESNWDYGEPGILFWDRIRNWNLLSETKDFEYAGVNPCAEEPLPAGGSCLLGSINLSEYVTKPFTEEAAFDYVSFDRDVAIAVKALNDVLDEGLPLHPLAEQRESVAKWRQIGLGIMGYADMLIKLGLQYGSDDAVEETALIGRSLNYAAIKKSESLALEGKSYDGFDFESVNKTPYLIDKTIGAVSAMANSQLLTIAPTGTLSTMLGISGGVEPVYANSYTRKTESLHGHDEYYKIYTPIVDEFMKANGIEDEEDLPDYFVTAMTLSPDARIKAQGVWQQYIDASISSTVNLPHSATIQNVFDIYVEAWKAGLKGITVFRDGCKRAGILSTNSEEEEVDPADLKRGEIVAINDNVIGVKRKITTGCGNMHCIAMFDPETGNPLEVYLSKGSTGGCNNFMVGLSRMISLALRGGIDIYTVVDQLTSAGACPSYASRTAVRKDTSKGSSCPMAVGYALIEMYEEMQEKIKNSDTPAAPKKIVYSKEEAVTKNKILCPQCGEPLAFEGGCNTCKACGWSKCS